MGAQVFDLATDDKNPYYTTKNKDHLPPLVQDQIYGSFEIENLV